MAQNDKKESMSDRSNRYVSEKFDDTSEWLAARPGFIPLLGILLIILNFAIHLFTDGNGWLGRTDLFLHLGLIMSIIGLLLIKPLQ